MGGPLFPSPLPLPPHRLSSSLGCPEWGGGETHITKKFVGRLLIVLGLRSTGLRQLGGTLIHVPLDPLGLHLWVQKQAQETEQFNFSHVGSAPYPRGTLEAWGGLEGGSQCLGA